MYRQSQADKKLISLFKAFVDKALLPQIRKAEGSLLEWHKFCTFIQTDTINYDELQSYVNSLPIPNEIASLRNNEKFGMDMKNFNPNNTFGGRTSKTTMLGNMEMEGRPSQREDSMKQKSNLNNNNVSVGLHTLLKSLEQNQAGIDVMIRNVGIEGSQAKQARSEPHSACTIPIGNISHQGSLQTHSQSHLQQPGIIQITSRISNGFNGSSTPNVFFKGHN